MSEYATKETLGKEKFSTGAQRNDANGKGRYVLVSPMALRRLAGVYERGSLAHGIRNWERGLPISRCLDSAIRHIYQYIEGMRDEDHLGQAVWNLCAAIHMEEMVERGLLPKELNDMPNYLPEESDVSPASLEPGGGSDPLQALPPLVDDLKGRRIHVIGRGPGRILGWWWMPQDDQRALRVDFAHGEGVVDLDEKALADCLAAVSSLQPYVGRTVKIADGLGEIKQITDLGQGAGTTIAADIMMLDSSYRMGWGFKDRAELDAAIRRCASE